MRVIIPKPSNIPRASPPPKPPAFTQRLETFGRAFELNKEVNKDLEVIVPLNHWERRYIYPGVDPMVITSPIFDFWYDHLAEESFASGYMATQSGGPSQAAGTSPVTAIRWQNHRFDFTTKVITAFGTLSVATLEIFGGMNFQSTDEPVIISTQNVLSDFSMPDRMKVITGRANMRFLQFRYTFTQTVVTALDIIQQIGVRST